MSIIFSTLRHSLLFKSKLTLYTMYTINKNVSKKTTQKFLRCFLKKVYTFLPKQHLSNVWTKFMNTNSIVYEWYFTKILAQQTIYIIHRSELRLVSTWRAYYTYIAWDRFETKAFTITRNEEYLKSCIKWVIWIPCNLRYCWALANHVISRLRNKFDINLSF